MVSVDPWGGAGIELTLNSPVIPEGGRRWEPAIPGGGRDRIDPELTCNTRGEGGERRVRRRRRAEACDTGGGRGRVNWPLYDIAITNIIWHVLQ